MPLQIVRDDITKIKVDAIVNPTNPFFAAFGGTDKQIHDAAGKQLDLFCSSLPKLEVSDVVLTSAYEMKNTKYIIHTCGPIYSIENKVQNEQLRLCYLNALLLAKKNNINSIAFPLISTGTYGYPKRDSLSIANDVIINFLFENEMNVYLLVYDNEAFDLSNKLFVGVKDYLKENGVDKDDSQFIDDKYAPVESFNNCLKRLIFEKNLVESDIWKQSNIDRKLFSKIYSNKTNPKKNNVLALAIGMKLNLEETTELVQKAGFSFGFSKMDFIIKYFIENSFYDIYRINDVLFTQGLTTLGSKD